MAYKRAATRYEAEEKVLAVAKSTAAMLRDLPPDSVLANNALRAAVDDLERFDEYDRNQ